MLPLSEIPLSVIGFFIGFLAITGLGIRSFIRYRSLKTPLNYYFGLTGIIFGIGLFFYSVPFMLTHTGGWLKAAFAVGDAFIFGGLIVTAQVLWYVQLHKLIRHRAVMLIPLILIAITSYTINTYYTITKATVAIENGEVTYTLPKLGLYLWGPLYLLLIAVGVYFIRHAWQAVSAGGRIRSLSLGALYIIAGMGGVTNTLFFGGEVSPASAVAYVVVFAVFLVSLVSVNLKTRRQQTGQPQPPKSNVPTD